MTDLQIRWCGGAAAHCAFSTVLGSVLGSLARLLISDYAKRARQMRCRLESIRQPENESLIRDAARMVAAQIQTHFPGSAHRAAASGKLAPNHRE